MVKWDIRILEINTEMLAVEALQQQVWPGSAVDAVPAHLLITIAQNGSPVIGAFRSDEDRENQRLIGFVYGFPGLDESPDGQRFRFCSHQMGVHPDYQGHGVGFDLKRAQWQMARNQGYDRITWTYDPLLSLNAYLNIGKLGTTCNTYKREVYGEMRDGLNVGLPSDRFQVDWWLHSPRVEQRLSQKSRRRLDLAHFTSAGAEIINPARYDRDGLVIPHPEDPALPSSFAPLLLLEIPPNFLSLKAAAKDLALEWRLHTRALFENLFAHGYLVTDFVYQSGAQPRSFYVLSHGESTL